MQCALCDLKRRKEEKRLIQVNKYSSKNENGNKINLDLKTFTSVGRFFHLIASTLGSTTWPEPTDLLVLLALEFISISSINP